MEPLEAAVREKVRLEKTWKMYQTRARLIGFGMFSMWALWLLDRHTSFQPFRGLSIGPYRVLDLLALAYLVGFGVTMFPSKRERKTWAQLTLLELRISEDIQTFIKKLDSLRRSGIFEFINNPTFRYWVPLYREFQRLGIDVPAPVEERFARLDRNRLDIFWAPVRRERQLKALKSVE